VGERLLRELQLKAAGRVPEWRDLLLVEGGAGVWLRLTQLREWKRDSYLSLINGETVHPQKGTLEQLLLRTSVAMEDL
jgi:hypothetical protein